MQVLERHGKRDRREDGAAVCMDGMTFRRLIRQLKDQRISFRNIFTIHPFINLTINYAHVMVNLFGRRSIWRPSLTDTYSGLTPSTGRGYNTVSMSSLYDPTRLRTDLGVLFEVVSRRRASSIHELLKVQILNCFGQPLGL